MTNEQKIAIQNFQTNSHPDAYNIFQKDVDNFEIEHKTC